MDKKKLIVILIAVILVAAAAAVVIALLLNRDPQVGKFDLAEYRTEIEAFPSDEAIGPVKDAKDLLEKAEKVLKKVFGDTVDDEKPYSVSYDEKNGAWLVSGKPGPGEGGEAHIIVENSGKVLAVWHEK